MIRNTMIALLIAVTLTACQQGTAQPSQPEKTPVEKAVKTSPQAKMNTPQATAVREFEAFRADFSKEFTPFKLGPEDKAKGSPIAVDEQLAYLKRSVEAVPVAEILMDDETYISLVTAEHPLEDVQVFVWNVFDVGGELLSHRIVGGVEGEDEFHGEFHSDGTVLVENYYSAGVDELGEELSGKRETTYALEDGKIVKQ